MPIDPLGVGLSVVGGLLGGSSKKKQAKAQAEYNRKLQIQRNKYYRQMLAYQQRLASFQKQRYEFTATAAKQDADRNYSAVLEQLGQRKKQAFDKIAQYDMKAYQDIGRMRVGRETTAGQSVQLANQALLASAARNIEITQDDYEGKLRQGQRQFNALQAQAQNRINAAMPSPLAPIRPPDQLPGTYVPGTGDMFAGILGNIGGSLIAGAIG